MGGKAKTSQRTKNNARPSSSGRSAELLNAAKAEQYSGADSGTPVLFPSLATLSLDQGLTAEYSVCFKKFTKKDPVTKTKALQELTQLVNAGDVANTEAALPSWAHHYQSLSIDCDRRVREATQTCHGAVVGACGRRVAPQLRRLLPVWLLALHDDHAPAGSVAHKHLQNTFPDGKLPEALSFCKAEIMALLSDNLTGNADAMVGKRIEDSDERQSAVARVLASSLHALQLLLTALPTAHTDWLWDSHVAALLQHNYFWGLARHQSQPIRAAWYGSVGQIIERFGARIPLQIGKKAAKALVAEPERNAGVAAQRWAALLLLMRHVEEWHLWLEKKDLLITRLLDMIENGAWGSARLLSSVLVPLLARLPADLLTKHFYIKLFDAMFTGLNTKNLLNSKSERQTWISNLAECLRYLSTQSHDFAIEVITYAHRTWLERVLDIKESQARTNLIRHSMTHMSSLIKHWLNQSKAEKEKYDQLTRNFWQNICSTVLTQIDKLSIAREDIVQAIESHILLLKTLQTSFLNEPKKKMSIQFEDQKIDLSKIYDTSFETLDVSCDEQGRELFKHNLNDLVQKICCSYFDFAYKKQVSQAVCPVLTNLLIEFDSRELFASVAKHFGADTVYGFYDEALRPWLAGDTMRCKALVEMVFLVVRYMSEDEQDSMFSSFQQFPPPVVEWCMRLSLSHPYSGLGAARRWLRGPVAQASVLALCRREGDSQAKSLLLMCMAPDYSGEVMVGESSVGLVVGEISAGLESEAAPCARARLAAELAGVLARGAAWQHAQALLGPLLRYRLRLSRHGRPAVEFGSALVWDAWRDALPALPARLRGDLLRHALRDVCAHVLHDMKELDIPRIDDAASCCPPLFCASEGNEPSITEIVSLTEILFAQIETKQPTTPLEFYALRCDCIHGNIIPAFERNNAVCKKIASESEKNHEELSRDDLMVSVYKSLFRVSFLRRITQNIPDSDVKSNAWCNSLLSERHFKEVFGWVMYDYAVIITLYEYYAFWPHYEIIYQTKNQMESQIEDILADITIETKNSLYSFLTESFAKQGLFYWPFARKLFDIKFNKVTAKINEHKIPENPHIREENEDDDFEKDTSENLAKIHHDDISELESPLQSGKNDSETATEEKMFRSEPDQENIEFSTLKQGISQAELIDLKSRSEQSKTEFKTEKSETESKTEQSETESKSEQSITESKTEQSETKSKTEHGKTESKSELIKTKSKIEHRETESKSEQSKTESKPEQSKTESKTQHGETESKSDQIKTESKKEHGETESKSDQSISEAKPEHSETESKPENSTFESASEHDEELKCFADKSEYVDDEQWVISLGFPTLQEVVSNSGYYLNLEAEAKYSPDATRDSGTRYMVMMRSALSAHMYSPSVAVQLLADMVEGLNPLINGYYDHGKAQSLLLVERELTGVPWGHVMSNAAVLDYLSDMVAANGRLMADFYWDFVNIALSSLLDSVRRTAHRWGTTNVSCLMRASCRLLSRVSAFMRELRRDGPAPPQDQDLNKLLEEWHDIFEPDVNKQLFTVLLTVLRSTDTPVTASSVATIGCLIEATRHMDFDALSRLQGLEPTLTMEALAEAAIRALRGMTHHAYKYLAFHTLQLIAKPLVYEDVQKLEQRNAREQGAHAPRPATCLALFHDAMTQLHDYTEAALSNVALCEGTCEMVPFSDSHSVSLGYLLLAAALLRLCGHVCGDLHQVYTAEFRDRMYAEGLMSCTLRLLPAPVAAFAFVRGAPLTAPALRAFRALPALDVYERCSGGTVSALACYVLTETLGGPGAAGARSWSGSRPPLCAAALRRLVPVAVAPVLLRRHLLQLKRRGHELPDARISIKWPRAEVQCWIELEEHELELCIRFAPEHPLVPPSVTSPPSSPTPDTSWIVIYLTYQNGTLLNALKMWIRAVNSRVQSAPQCYVCYCRMHPVSGRFPGVPCHQCRNKFHYACLSKWFMHSQKTNCPLCRTKF